MKLKYIVKFNITNLDKATLREFKINLINSKNVMEFESDSIPRIPESKDKIMIAGREFRMNTYTVEWVYTDTEIQNVFTCSIIDVETEKIQIEEHSRLIAKAKADQEGLLAKAMSDALGSRYKYGKYLDEV